MSRYFGVMARKDITMSPAEVLEFLEEPRTIQVATIGRDETPHVAPMWYLVHEEKVAFRSFTKSQKIVNLLRDPRLTLLAEEGTAYSELRGVMIKGTARFVDDPAVILDWYGKLAGRYAFFGDDPTPDLDPDALNQAFGRFAAKNTGVIVEPTKVVSWDHTKLAGAY